MKRSKIILAVAAAAVIVIAAGCIMTGTFVITVKLVPPGPVTVSNADYTEGRQQVDLTQESDFADNQDKIKDIDNIGFYASVKNNLNDPVTFQLFLEKDTAKDWDSAQEAADSCTALILTSLTIPGKKTVTIDWNESLKYVTGLNDIKKILETGHFSLYPVAIPRDNFSLTIDSLVIIVTLTGG